MCYSDVGLQTGDLNGEEDDLNEGALEQAQSL